MIPRSLVRIVTPCLLILAARAMNSAGHDGQRLLALERKNIYSTFQLQPLPSNGSDTKTVTQAEEELDLPAVESELVDLAARGRGRAGRGRVDNANPQAPRRWWQGWSLTDKF